MRRIDILPGEQHGCYIVMGKSSKTGKQDFFAVRCKCGCETVIGKSQLLSNPQRCRQCAGRRYTAMMQDKRKEMIGQTVNGFRIIDIAPSGTGAAKFVVECVICGNRSVKTISAILADNRMALDAGWDDDLLRVEIEALQGMDFDVSFTGFDEKEICSHGRNSLSGTCSAF